MKPTCLNRNCSSISDEVDEYGEGVVGGMRKVGRGFVSMPQKFPQETGFCKAVFCSDARSGWVHPLSIGN